MQSDTLIQSLTEQTQEITTKVEQLKELDTPTLLWRENSTSWNILECLEHLNLYGDFYLPEMERKIRNSHKKSEKEFKSGFLGNYFANSMLPKAKLNKMKTFKDKNPLNAALERSVIDRFLEQQTQLLELLELSKNVSLNKVKTNLSITKLIKLKLGDTFRFYINHMLRHMNQIDNILRAQIKL
jgi:hypothetical protein